jgi:hypothetical protein
MRISRAVADVKLISGVLAILLAGLRTMNGQG